MINHYPPKMGRSICSYSRLFFAFIGCFLLVGQLAAASPVAAQARITLIAKEISLAKIFSFVDQTSDHTVVYRNDMIDQYSSLKIDMNMIDATAEQIIGKALTGTDLKYIVSKKTIVIQKNGSQEISQMQQQQQQQKRILRGKIVDEKKYPVPGATIIVKNRMVGVVSTPQGTFSIELPSGADSIVVSFVGYTTQYLSVNGVDELNIRLFPSVEQMDEVIINGVTSRKAESYTGAIVSVSAADLKRVGNQNVFQSLKNLDPSIFIKENFEMGSDPNSLPDINMRGGTSFSEQMDANLKGNYQNRPNQPLFILNGFEVSVEKIFDLDMNIVDNLTILKDASAKALYGSKAANGVVVIETQKLKSDKPRITYTGSFDFQFPDLSSYNMCNAMEKLDIEFKELYREGSFNDNNQDILDNYYARRKAALEGMNTDWLAKPVQMGFGHKHTLNLELGKEDLRIGVNLSYKDVTGVMKKSDRKIFSADFDINYLFMERFRFQNLMSVTSVNAANTPFGNFISYTALNPYEDMYDEYGQIRPMIGNSPNPYYDGTLKTRLTDGYIALTDNFQAEWTIIEGLKFRARLGIEVKRSEADQYYPATHSKFSQYPADKVDEKGSYTINQGKSFKMSGDVVLNYSKVFAGKHIFFTNLLANWSDYDYREVIQTAVGLPSDNMDNIMFALKYAEGSRPRGVSGLEREFGATGMFSYSYDNRFISDLTLRSSASSMFGNDKRWATFWSVGLGWNIHHEKFIKDLVWLKQLKIRGSAGSTGNQNFQNNKSLAVYEYQLGDRYDGFVGSLLKNMENPKLQWEQKMDYNFGVDAEVYGFSIRFDLYNSITENMVTKIATAPSTGFSYVSDNIGKVENKGYELKVAYKVLQNKDAYLNLTASVASNTNKILRISDAMKTYNESIKAMYASRDSAFITVPAILYEDGMDMEAIWAVTSLGIDPATGLELLQGKNGRKTYIWKPTDMQVQGTMSPKLRGNFGVNGEYKGIGMSVTCTFLYGGQYYNQTLLNKIENIDIKNNFDRRALTERWGTIGQEAYFKTLSGYTPYDMRNGTFWPTTSGWHQEATRASSRFVQDRNELNISQISLYYDLPRTLTRQLGMQRLKISAYANDIVKFSTIGVERGTTYPFSRSMSFSITATF